MTTYIINRLLQTVLMLVVLSVMFFLLVHLQPGGGGCLGANPLACEQAQHLDQPIVAQYLDYVGTLLHGNFGVSATGQPIGQEISQKLPPTILLVGLSFFIQQLIALPLGMLAALRHYSVFDGSLTLASYIFLSLPAFVLGPLLIFAFGARLGWFPAGHYEDPSLPLLWSGDWFHALLTNPGLVLGDLLLHLALPAATLTVTGIAIDSRFMRAAMLAVLHQDYIRTARAKGVSRRAIIFKHAFRNAILPIVTNIGLYLPALVGGVIVVEYIFSWGGLGVMFATAIGGGIGQGFGFANPDFPVLQTLLLLSALAVLLANLLADIVYVWLDPRIRYDTGGAE